MMRNFHYINILFCLMMAYVVNSCSQDVSTSNHSQLVVEGWIDAGEHPVVKLTRTVALNTDEFQLDSLSRYVERWAKVSISDGEKTEVMVGRYDKNYFPPFVYTTYDMRGEVGKEYKLMVETPDGILAEAKTTIPAPAKIDSFKVEPTDMDGFYQLYAYTTCKERCKLFTMVEDAVDGEQTEYHSAELGLLDKGMIGSDNRISVKRGYYNLKKHTPFFRRFGIVKVKFSTLNDESYDFWRSFEDLIALSRVPLMPVNTNLKSNVKGALGYWCGYGSTFYEVFIIE